MINRIRLRNAVSGKRARFLKVGVPALGLAAAVALGAVGPGLVTTEAGYTSTASSSLNAEAQQWIVPTFEAFPNDYRSGTLTWTKAGSYGASYRVQWSTSANFSNPLSATVTGTRYVVTGLAATTTYYFRVQATDAPTAPVRGWSATADMKTPAQAPTARSLLYSTDDPHGMALDSVGNSWVADYTTGTIRRISPTGVVTNIGATVADSNPRGLALVNDNTALIARSYDLNRANPLAGLYTMSSSGVAKLVVPLWNAYGVVYNKKTNKVYVSYDEGNLSECDYGTWKCTLVLSRSQGNIFHLDLTPDGTKVTMAGADSDVLSVFDIATRKKTVLINTPNLDVRGVKAIGNTDFLVSSYRGGFIWRVKLDPVTGAVSTDALVTGGDGARTLMYDAAKNIVYVGMTKDPRSTSGVYKYTDLIR